MNTPNIPGFTAEAALAPPLKAYYESSAETAARGAIIPQARSYYDWCYETCRADGNGWLRCRLRCGRPWA